MQVYSYVLYDMWETALSRRAKEPLSLITRSTLRCAYVAATGLVALAVPFFGDLMGLIGAIAVTPTTFVLPPALWLVWRRPKPFSRTWCVNWSLAVVCTCIGVLGTAGSLYSIVQDASTYTFFSTSSS